MTHEEEKAEFSQDLMALIVDYSEATEQSDVQALFWAAGHATGAALKVLYYQFSPTRRARHFRRSMR